VIVDGAMALLLQAACAGFSRAIPVEPIAGARPYVEVRLAVAGDQLRPMITIKVGSDDLQEWNVSVYDLRRICRRQPYLDGQRIAPIHDDVVALAVPVKISRE